MKQGKRPALSFKKALLKSSSARSMETDDQVPLDTETYLIEIMPGLYIANYNTVKDAELLEQKDIQVVINLISHKCYNHHPDRFIYENYELADTPNADLLKIIENVVLGVQSHLKNGRGVVIHCLKGISRAPATVIAYLMKVELLSFDAAFDLVKSKSRRIDPNVGFLMQLSYLI